MITACTLYQQIHQLHTNTRIHTLAGLVLEILLCVTEDTDGLVCREVTVHIIKSFHSGNTMSSKSTN